MDFSLLAEVVAELAAFLPGSRVDRVVQDQGGNLVLLLHGKGGKQALLLAPDRFFPRIHLLSQSPALQTISAPFFLSLKKNLIGTRLVGIEVVNSDRVVELRFHRFDREWRLFFELIGARTNLILTGGDRSIMTVLHPVAPGERAGRVLVPGISYEPPPLWPQTGKAQGSDLPSIDAEETADRCCRASRAAEELSRTLIAERELSSFRRMLLSALGRSIARAERRYEALQHDLEGAEKSDEYRKVGELILANLRDLGNGQERAVLEEPDGSVRTVLLDPSRSAVRNAEQYFRRYKKAKAGMAIIQSRLAEARKEVHFLKSILQNIETADLSGLTVARGLLEERGLLGRATADGKRCKAPVPTYRTVLHDGWEILIGKSASGNDELSTRVARPDDLWLHAEGMPGSHVVVRNPSKRPVPDGVLGRAASLAAYYSKGRNAVQVPVVYTLARYVKKPKGAAPGTVVLMQRKSVAAKPAPPP